MDYSCSLLYRLIILLAPFYDGGGGIVVVFSLEQCCREGGGDGAPSPPFVGGGDSGGLCPTGNTCCCVSSRRREEEEGWKTSRQKLAGCIPSDMGARNATCCNDDDGGATTGCAVGYTCARKKRKSKKFCQAGPHVTDPLVQELPRYRLCHSDVLDQVHGLPVNVNKNHNNDEETMLHHHSNDAAVAGATSSSSGTTSTTSSSDNDDNDDHPKVAYYSNVGDLTRLSISTRTKIQMAVIVVHGSGRNADDYFCSTMAATEQAQRYYDADSVLVIAPRFATTKDADDDLDHLREGGIAIRWGNDDNDDDGGGKPSWRDGADAVFPSSLRSFSSFDAMDLFVELLVASNNNHRRLLFPSLERVSVVGHSAGGQFVQRWSLLTSTIRADDAYPIARIVSVVANPSSYAYLSPVRRIHGMWQVPSQEQRRLCPQYDEWKWGLEPAGAKSNDTFTVPHYVESAVRTAGGIPGLIRRLATSRNVAYLAGGLDVCNVSGTSRDGWCFSHGLETTCMDELQGTNRSERHANYMALLRDVLNITSSNHRSVTVPGVGHDHSLMFNSPEGIRAIFGPWEKNNSKKNGGGSSTMSGTRTTATTVRTSILL